MIVPFKAIDWYIDDPIEPILNPGNIAERLEKQGMGISVFDDDGCFGCGGLLFYNNGTAEAWVRIDRRGFKHRKSGIRAIKEGFKILTNVCKSKIFCWVDIDWEEADRLVTWLGFVKGKETRELNNRTYLMWDYDDGNDYDGYRHGSKRCGCNATVRDDAAAGRSPSTNT